MRLLHICSDYSNQALYKQMIIHLQEENLEQIVYVPVRKESEINKYNIETYKNIQIVYDHCLRKRHRFLFKMKIAHITNRIIAKIDFKKIELIHGHFLFSDGAVALKIKQKLNIPYIVTVRNTDVNLFFKYMFHLRRKGIEILLNADRIIFLTPAYVNEVISKYIPTDLHEAIKMKISILPNGLNEYWIENINERIVQKTDLLRILYVGDFTPNKNVLSIIKCVEQLKDEGINIQLTLVGGGGSNSKTVMDRLKNCDKKTVQFHKSTSNKDDLLSYYRANDLFIMPSFKETFGIVYLEAMSQGLPILYSQGQGVDGYFANDPPGYAVNPYSIEDLKSKVLLAYNNIEILSANSLIHIKGFSWPKIAEEYRNIYNSIVK